MEHKRPLQSIPDDELLHRLTELLRQSRRVESDLVAHIGEVDERRLYAREASPSMFACCTEVLHLSEAEAYLRIAAARASREHPMLLAMLADGRLHLTGIAKHSPRGGPSRRPRSHSVETEWRWRPWNSVRTEFFLRLQPRPGPRSLCPSRPLGTGCSSRPAPSSATSWSDSGP